MSKKHRGSMRLVLVMALLAAMVGGAVAYRVWKKRNVVVNPPPIVPATKPAPLALASTRPSHVEPQLDPYIKAIRTDYPTFAATQPLGIPLQLAQAAHLRLHDPIYLGGLTREEMWITQPDAAPTEAVLKDAVADDKDIDVHITREHVAFVHWMPNSNGNWPPIIVCVRNDGGYDVVSTKLGRQSLPTHRQFRWEHAMSWDEKVVVPSGHGISIFRFAPRVIESYHDLAPTGAASQPADAYAEPRMLLDWQGLLAWLPWENKKMGGRGAARYIETASEDPATSPQGKWTDLSPENGWPERILHLVPLLDGTVLMLDVDPQGAVHLQFNSLEHAGANEEEVNKLVAQLADPDQIVRNAASDKLAQYGPGIWPILEKLLPDQEPEAQLRMRRLLKQKVAPTLNGMSLLGKKELSLAARLADGGSVFYAPQGVAIPNLEDPDATPDYHVPAWISIRPGHSIELLPPIIANELAPAKSRIYVNGADWIISDEVRGARRFVGNGFVPLTRKSERDFNEFLGSDRRGRWLFRHPDSSPTTQSINDPSETLIIDPTLPDPTPRLPVWVFDTAQEVGWTQEDWPVAKNVSAYALHENNWVLMGEKEKMFSKAGEVPPPVEHAFGNTTQPAATQVAATQATTSPTTEPAEAPILTDRDGAKYFGGLTDLRVIDSHGREKTWILPDIANGKGPVWLVRMADGRLFLFNQPGRVLRIKPTSGDAEPYSLEKIFTHNIPSTDHPTRIWADPAGRINIAWENRLAILFTAGYIPQPITELITHGNDDPEEE